MSFLPWKVPGAVQSHGSLSLAVLESKAAPVPRCVAGVGLASGSVCSHSPFPTQGILSTHLLGKALVRTELCFLQLCSAAGKGLGLRVLGL